MTSFDDAVRALARREGFDVSDDTPVLVAMFEEWSGYSEFTITNRWDSFRVQCGDFKRNYESEDWARNPPAELRDHDDFYELRPVVALAKLWADLGA